MSHSCKNIMIGFGERNKQDETHITKKTLPMSQSQRCHTDYRFYTVRDLCIQDT